MSRIRFEWTVESQQSERFDGEDPEAKRGRRRNMLLLLALVCILLAAIALALLLARQRIIDVERQHAQLLQDTVKAEVAALRIGDLHSFLKVQAADDATWRSHQQAMFQYYSDLKAGGAIELTGGILAVAIDGERGRALVQENINELPYARLWFYRRGAEGWRHTAPDPSFWGEDSQIESPRVLVSYRAADFDFARQVGAALEAWIAKGCALLDCGRLPRLRVAVEAQAPDEAAWIDEAEMRLRLRSPYVDLARADTPFDGRRQFLVSAMLAERLVDAHTKYLQVESPHDAFFLRQGAIAWLSETFTQLDSGARLMRSLADHYGKHKVAQLLSLLAATSDMSLIETVIQQPIASAKLDWGDFVEWRLRLENELLAADRRHEWLELYDTRDESARLAANARYGRGPIERDYRVIDQQIWSERAGEPQLRATVRVNAGDGVADEIVLFNLVKGVWKRAN